MKLRNLILLPLMLVASLAVAQPQLVWLSPTHDFGAFREEAGPARCTFLAVNTGSEPISVIDARANCGCTRPTYNRAPVAPGDTLRVSVAYDPAGRPGRFRKQVKVTTNAGSDVMTITGTVIGSSNTLRSRFPIEAGTARISNNIAPFGETTKGRVLAAAINIYNPTADTIVPAIKNKPETINAMFRPEIIPPGEQSTLSLTAYTDRATSYGTIEETFTLLPDSRRSDLGVEIQTVMIVNEDFSKLSEKELANAPHALLSDTSVDFGSVSPESGKLTRTVTLTNTGKSPLLLRRIQSADPAVSIKCSATKIKPGHKAEITLTLNPSQLSPATLTQGYLNSRLTLITNDPDNPTQTIRLLSPNLPK